MYLIYIFEFIKNNNFLGLQILDRFDKSYGIFWKPSINYPISFSFVLTNIIYIIYYYLYLKYYLL